MTKKPPGRELEVWSSGASAVSGTCCWGFGWCGGGALAWAAGGAAPTAVAAEDVLREALSRLRARMLSFSRRRRQRRRRLDEYSWWGGVAGAVPCVRLPGGYFAGVEHLRPGRYGGQPDVRRLPPRSFAHLKLSITAAKWQEAKAWADAKVTGKKYRYSRHRKPRRRPETIPATATKRLAARFYQLYIIGTFCSFTVRTIKQHSMVTAWV
jgi:hypothetical protein